MNTIALGGLALISGALSFLAGPVLHFWPAAWLAPVPLLAVVPELSPVRSATITLIAALFGTLSFVLAYQTFPVPVQILLVVMIALPSVPAVLLWRFVKRRQGPYVALIAWPAITVTLEFLIASFSPHGTFGSIGYTQADVTILLQIVAITGLWGITFLLSLFAAALALAWRLRHTHRTRYVIPALGILPIAFALLFGGISLGAPSMGESVRIGLAASDVNLGRIFATDDAEVALAAVSTAAERAGRLAAQGAEFVVLPEKFVGTTPEYETSARAILADAARQSRVYIIAGLNARSAGASRNLTIVFDPHGSTVLEYDKQHLVPGFEDGYRRGEYSGLIPGSDPVIGIAICKDLDFVKSGRDYGNAGAGLLLVPAWDFIHDAWLHSRMAILRGVENGFAVARSANEGLLTLNDARGRMLAEIPSWQGAEALTINDVPIAPGGTFYSKTGDWLPLIASGVVAIISLWSAIETMSARRRQATGKPPLQQV